jgi:hypothetical protein
VYDVAKLKSLAECRTVMQRAREHNMPQVYEAVFRRMCQLVGSANDDPNDRLVRDFHETLAAYEQLLTEKNGQSTSASRTRQKIANKGVYQSLVEWTCGAWLIPDDAARPASRRPLAASPVFAWTAVRELRR